MRLNSIKYLKLALTNRCNSHCMTCWHSNRSKMPPLVDLDPEIYTQLRKELFPYLKVLDLLSGGELFACRYVDRLLDDIKQFRFKTIIESNFSMIRDNQRRSLKHTNVRFIVSLDGSYKRLQEYLRPQCTYEAVLDNIRYFVGEKKQVTIRMTVSNHNFYDMEAMLKLAERLGVDGVIFHGVQPLGCLEEPYKFNPPPKDMEYVQRLLKGKYQVNYDLFLDYYRKNSIFVNPVRGFYCIADPMTAQGAGISVKFRYLYSLIMGKECCPVSRNFINVHLDGKLHPCSCHESPMMGDLTQQSLKEIVEAPEYDTMRTMCSCKLATRHLHAN